MTASRRLVLAIVAYASVMTAANLSIVAFGPSAALVNAFVFIGLDLALRDWLHVRIGRLQMLTLIGASGALTFALNPAAAHIAAASAGAFTAAALIDWAVFSALPGSWMLRANVSNLAGAVVDSLVFVQLADLPMALVPQMVVAKALGGAAWAWALSRVQFATRHQMKGE